MVCTRKQASHLLQGLRKDNELLTPEERNQAKYFILGFYLKDTSGGYNPHHAEIGSETLIAQFSEESHGR